MQLDFNIIPIGISMYTEKPIYVLAAIIGVLAHLGVFIRGEWHLQAPAVVSFHISFAAFMRGTWDLQHHSLPPFFSPHRLRHFLGPRFVAVAKLWHIFQCWDSRNNLMLDSIHKQYGNFVRTGKLALTVHVEPLDAVRLTSLLQGPNESTVSIQLCTTQWMVLTIETQGRMGMTWSIQEPLQSLHAAKNFMQKNVAYEIRRFQKKVRLTFYFSVYSQVDIWSRKGIFIPNPEANIDPGSNYSQMRLPANHKSTTLCNSLHSVKLHDAIAQQRSALALLGPLNSVIWISFLAFSFLPSAWRVRDWFGMMVFFDSCVKTHSEVRTPIFFWFLENVKCINSNQLTTFCFRPKWQNRTLRLGSLKYTIKIDIQEMKRPLKTYLIVYWHSHSCQEVVLHESLSKELFIYPTPDFCWVAYSATMS